MRSNKNHTDTQLVIIGAAGHAVSVANVALAAGYVVNCFVDKTRLNQKLFNLPVISDISELDWVQNYNFAIAVGDNAVREKIYYEIVEIFPDARFPSLVHSSAVVSFFSDIEEGVVVMPMAVIGPNSRVGKFSLINTRASLDHDSVMLNFSSLAPSATTGGKVNIGARSVVGIGANVKHGVKIGDDSILGAASYLNHDLPDFSVAYGVPAKFIRNRKLGEKYL